MSRVGKVPISVPQGVDVQIKDDQISVKGAQGTLTRAINELVDAGLEESRVGQNGRDVLELDARLGEIRHVPDGVAQIVERGNGGHFCLASSFSIILRNLFSAMF